MSKQINPSSANNKLIENLENQLGRLVEQLSDLEECKNELSADEFEMIQTESLDQLKEFGESLNRLQKGDITLTSKFSSMREAVRNAISNSFNTTDMIKLFAPQTPEIQEFIELLTKLEKEYKAKQISLTELDTRKNDIMSQIEINQLSSEGLKSLQNIENIINKSLLEEVPDDRS